MASTKSGVTSSNPGSFRISSSPASSLSAKRKSCNGVA
ncbi:Uncharacterised protein [Bordetella pertussis]|nr:Uncharacterised protein [Bordetella pertussis]